ncbi:MAG: dihydrofolate reductase [Bdellovibrionales bacterium]|nr:dihydrofolate reductase [Bdellovibrionales bacterium]
MIISIIAAMGTNRVIGKDNQMMWRLPLEFKYFKETTMGHHLIMGRKSFESISSSLPGRTKIVLSRDPNYEVPEDCFLSSSLEEALELAREREESEVFISGGGEIFAMALPYVDKLYLTYVNFQQEGDAYFPDVDLSNWKVESEVSFPETPKNAYAWVARVYSRNHS